MGEGNGKGGYQNKVMQIKGCNETLHGGGIVLHGLQGDTVLGGMENWPGWRMPSLDSILLDVLLTDRRQD